MDELWRVLKPTGTLYWNMDDSIREKGLLLLPQRFAIAASDRGWLVRQSIVWDKMDRGFPHRRPDCFDHFWEPILMFVKQKDYYFDQNSAKVPNSFRSDSERRLAEKIWSGKATASSDEGLRERAFNKSAVLGGERNFSTLDGASLRNQDGKVATDVWRMASTGYPGAHTATFPEALVERCVKVSSPPNGTVLDPFLGSGTTAVVAARYGRKVLGIDLNQSYIDMAWERIEKDGHATVQRTDEWV